MVALLDADILCYRVAAASENETEDTAMATLVSLLRI